MKRTIIVMLLLLIPSLAFADNTSWVKGGLAWGDLEGCDVDGSGPANCQDLDTEDEFFFQVSPFNVRTKINKSKFGVRFEPWMGYSQSKVNISESAFNDRTEADDGSLLGTTTDPVTGVTTVDGVTVTSYTFTI